MTHAHAWNEGSTIETAAAPSSADDRSKNRGRKWDEGKLPPGVHELRMDALASIVCFNQKRCQMWARLATFLLWPASSCDFSYAYLGGGYLTKKPNPNDIDVVLQTALPYGPKSFEAITPFFVNGFDEIQDVYGVHLHFWMENAPAGLQDYRAFFQYSRPKQPKSKLDPARGVAQIDLRDAHNLAVLRSHADSKP